MCYIRKYIQFIIVTCSIISIGGCSGGRIILLTEPLYQQYNHVQVELTHREESLKDSITPRCNGILDIDFRIRVPKELLNSNYRMILTPQLLKRDTFIALPDVVLNGHNFRLFQQQEHDLYNHASYKKYQRWKSMIEKRHQHFNIQKDNRSSQIRHNYSKKAQFALLNRTLQGKDTTGIMEYYTQRANQKTGLLPAFHYTRQISERSIPGKYRRYYLLDNATPYLAVDPMRPTNKIDPLFNENDDFFYLYRYEHPHQPETQHLRVILNGRIDATDYSAYVLPPSDTLNYVVSPLSQYIDTTQISVTPRVFRDIVHRQSCRFKFPVGKWTFDLNYEDNRAQMNEVMTAYTRFTRDEEVLMDSVVITAYASLDGRSVTNDKLCLLRATVIKDYLETIYNSASTTGSLFLARSHGEDVQSTLQQISEHTGLRNKEAILHLFTQNKDADVAENKVRWNYPADYHIISRDIYPGLRRVEITFHMRHPNMEVE